MYTLRISPINVYKACVTVFALTLISTLGACSGSGSSNLTGMPGAALSPPPAPGNGPPSAYCCGSDTGGGHWWGTLSRNEQVVKRAMCLVVESGEFSCILIDLANDSVVYDPALENIVGVVHGNVQDLDKGQARGSGKIYAAPNYRLADGTSVVADLTITAGSLLGDNTVLELTFTSLGEETTFSGFFDHYYYQSGIAWPPYGVYSTFDIFGDPASLSIDSNGALFLQSASGCSGSGRMTNINPLFPAGTPRYNAYTVGVIMSDCSVLNGAYSGLATLLDFAWVNGTDNLLIAIFNETSMIVGEAVK